MYWLMKSEPWEWSWDDQMKAGTAPWTGVRNFQARNFMKEMKTGDEVLFYHSGKGREILGIVKVAREHYPDPDDETGRFVRVDVGTPRGFVHPVPLAEIKAHPGLQTLPLIRQPRLSVMPITPQQWKILMEMGR